MTNEFSIGEAIREAEAMWMEACFAAFNTLWGTDKYTPFFGRHLFTDNKPIAVFTRDSMLLEAYATVLHSEDPGWNAGLHVNVYGEGHRHLGSVKIKFQDKLPREVAGELVFAIDQVEGGTA